MDSLREFFSNRRNLFSVGVLVFIALTLPLGLYLVKQQQSYQSSAAGELIQLAEGSCLQTINGKKTAICNTIPLKLINPFSLSSAIPSPTSGSSSSTAPGVSASPSPSPSTTASAANCPTTVTNGAQLFAAMGCYKTAGTGGKITLPAGTFEIDRKLSVPSNLTIIGAGKDQTVIKMSANFAKKTSPEASGDDALMANDSSHGQQNIILKDFTLLGDSQRSGNSCCYGLKLQNITNAFVINVGSNNWGIDGIFLGMRPNKPGAKFVRITGCTVNNNGRNGISLVDGTNNVIDHCTLSGNSTNELVAAIDLEPDNGNLVQNNHIFENNINGNRNNGIQLLTNPHDPGGEVSDNFVCNNTFGGNGGTDYDNKGFNTSTSGCTAGNLNPPTVLLPNTPALATTNSAWSLGQLFSFLPNFIVFGDDDNNGCGVNTACPNPSPASNDNIANSPSPVASNPSNASPSPTATPTPRATGSVQPTAAASSLVSPTAAATASSSASPTPPSGNNYRLAESQTALAQSPWIALTGQTMVTNFTASTTTGTKQIWVEFRHSSGQTLTDHLTYDLLPPAPVLNGLNCTLDIINKNVKVAINGKNLGPQKGTLTANGSAIEIASWSDTAIVGLIKGVGENAQKYSVILKRSDTLVAPTQTCEVNVSSLSVGARVFCREQGKFDVSNVKVSIFAPDAPEKKIDEVATIDKDGMLQGLKTKLAPGSSYVISLKAPYSVRRNATFTAQEGTTIINGASDKPFILPIGDIAPATSDGQINALDRAELVKQWRVLSSSSSAILTADFNRDLKVNSIDWACMKYDFNSKDDLPNSTGTSTGTASNVQINEGQSSVIFTND